MFGSCFRRLAVILVSDFCERETMCLVWACWLANHSLSLKFWQHINCLCFVQTWVDNTGSVFSEEQCHSTSALCFVLLLAHTSVLVWQKLKQIVLSPCIWYVCVLQCVCVYMFVIVIKTFLKPSPALCHTCNTGLPFLKLKAIVKFSKSVV